MFMLRLSWDVVEPAVFQHYFKRAFEFTAASPSVCATIEQGMWEKMVGILAFSNIGLLATVFKFNFGKKLKTKVNENRQVQFQKREFKAVGKCLTLPLTNLMGCLNSFEVRCGFSFVTIC